MTASWKPLAARAFVEDPKHIRGALDEAMNHHGPALVNIVLSQGSAKKPQQFRWHS
jgi:pyruvate/2-oxoacid:ferredoxin oxidoreductase beta subunit